jgi:hypothetical protein
MKALEIKKGETYKARVSGRLVQVTVLEILSIGNRVAGKHKLNYKVKNLVTNRVLTFDSAARFSCRVSLREKIGVTPEGILKSCIDSTPEVFTGRFITRTEGANLVAYVEIIKGEPTHRFVYDRSVKSWRRREANIGGAQFTLEQIQSEMVV